MKTYSKNGICAIVVFLFLMSLSSSAWANLLSNSDFELGTTSIVSGTIFPSAANSWGQWMNSAGTLYTNLSSAVVYHGSYSIYISTSGKSNGIYQYFNNSAHPDWPVTLGTWVYVTSGQVRIGVGNNHYGFATATSVNSGVWEYVEVTAPVSYHPNEVYIYSALGNGANYYADLASAHATPEPASLSLLGLGLLGLIGIKRRGRELC